MSEKPFWEGKTCKEMANLHVKVTFVTVPCLQDSDCSLGTLGAVETAPSCPFLPIEGQSASSPTGTSSPLNCWMTPSTSVSMIFTMFARANIFVADERQ